MVAPLPARDGEPMLRIADSFAVAVYPFVAGESFDGDSFTPQHCRAVLALLVAVHTAPPRVRDRALPDDFNIQFRDTLTAALDTGEPGVGPCAQPTADLLTVHAPGVRNAWPDRRLPDPLPRTHGSTTADDEETWNNLRQSVTTVAGFVAPT